MTVCVCVCAYVCGCVHRGYPAPPTETAINIGYSSKLLTEDMRVFIVDADSPEEVEAQMRWAGTGEGHQC